MVIECRFAAGNTIFLALRYTQDGPTLGSLNFLVLAKFILFTVAIKLH